jgi:hypothetical protein
MNPKEETIAKAVTSRRTSAGRAWRAQSRDVLAEGDENLDRSGCGRPHGALVELGFPFLKKGGRLVALGLGLGDVLGSRAGLEQSKPLACVHQHGVGDTRIALDNKPLRKSDGDADLHRVGAVECSARFLGASDCNTDAGFADRDLFWARTIEDALVLASAACKLAARTSMSLASGPQSSAIRTWPASTWSPSATLMVCTTPLCATPRVMEPVCGCDCAPAALAESESRSASGTRRL